MKPNSQLISSCYPVALRTWGWRKKRKTDKTQWGTKLLRHNKSSDCTARTAINKWLNKHPSPERLFAVKEAVTDTSNPAPPRGPSFLFQHHHSNAFTFTVCSLSLLETLSPHEEKSRLKWSHLECIISTRPLEKEIFKKAHTLTYTHTDSCLQQGFSQCRLPQ